MPGKDQVENVKDELEKKKTKAVALLSGGLDRQPCSKNDDGARG